MGGDGDRTIKTIRIIGIRRGGWTIGINLNVVES